MSTAQLAGGASGTGSLLLQAPNTNSSQTVNFPDATGTAMVSGNMPAFSYYQSVQQTGLSASTLSKITFTSSVFDTTGGMFASSRFTPTVAGYYQINASVTAVRQNTSDFNSVAIFKNGSVVNTGNLGNANAGGYPQSVVSSIIYCNGSTDYIEIYCNDNASSWSTYTGTNNTYFNGCMIRGA
jgi:hypothetical protein